MNVIKENSLLRADQDKHAHPAIFNSVLSLTILSCYVLQSSLHMDILQMQYLAQVYSWP